MKPQTRRVRRIAVAVTIAAAAVGLSACAGNQASSSAPSSQAAAQPQATSENGMPSSGAPMAAAPFGPACGAVPSNGPGSFSGMAADPVATAASHNPVLSTLVSAVQKANLVNTLNSAPNITVFAPSNDAFNKIPQSTLNSVLNNNAELTKILTYHVVGQRISPAQLASGSFKTLEGATLTTSGSGQDYTVNGNAHVICGNVQTANATVYIIDSVLMPPASNGG